MTAPALSFLLCSERSGSNLVTRILDAHSAVCGPSPLHLLRIFVPLQAAYGDLRDDTRWQRLVADVLHFFRLKIGAWQTEADAASLLRLPERSLAAIVRHLYAAEAARHGKTLAFVKENHAWRLLPYLDRHFPGAPLVWAVRDPRDMALSWKRAAVLRGGVVRAAQVWRQDQQGSRAVHDTLQAERRVLRLRYEDLLADPATEAARLAAHLGLAFEPGMIELQRSDGAARHAEASVVWANLGRGVLRHNAGQYRQGLDADELAYVEQLCRDEMQALGYDCETAPMAAAAFARLEQALQQREPHDKPAYQRVAAAEREQRRRWVQCVADLQAQAVSA